MLKITSCSVIRTLNTILEATVSLSSCPIYVAFLSNLLLGFGRAAHERRQATKWA